MVRREIWGLEIELKVHVYRLYSKYVQVKYAFCLV